MNKEHFLTELTIYLKPLSSKERAEILATYEELFQDGLAQGQTEEVIAKGLGKPKDIAADILAEHHLDFQEKKIYRNVWQEFKPEHRKYEGPRFDQKDYTTSQAKNNQQTQEVQDDFPYAEQYGDYRRPPKSQSVLKKLMLLAFNLLIFIWAWFSIFMTCIACWLTVVVLLCAPLIGVGLFFFLPFSAAIFQMAIAMILFGCGLLGVCVGRPITHFFFSLTKRYWRFNRTVFSGGV